MVSIHKSYCYLTDEESIPSRDLNQWRGALTEHEQLLKRWQKAWVGLLLHAGVFFLCLCRCLGFNLLCMFGFRPVV